MCGKKLRCTLPTGPPHLLFIGQRGVFASGWWGRASCEYVLLPEGLWGRAPLSLSQVPGRRAQLGIRIPLCHARLPKATQWDTWRFGFSFFSSRGPASLPACSMFLQKWRRLGITRVCFSLLHLWVCCHPIGPLSLKYCQLSVWNAHVLSIYGSVGLSLNVLNPIFVCNAVKTEEKKTFLILTFYRYPELFNS